jgi:hypothetical protein
MGWVTVGEDFDSLQIQEIQFHIVQFCSGSTWRLFP